MDNIFYHKEIIKCCPYDLYRHIEQLRVRFSKKGIFSEKQFLENTIIGQ